MILTLSDQKRTEIDTDLVEHQMNNQLCHTDEKTGEVIPVGSAYITLFLQGGAKVHAFYDDIEVRNADERRIRGARK